MCGESGEIVSVVIPAYNPAIGEFLSALASCLEQTYQELDVVVIDDGSDSLNTSVIDEIVLVDPRVRVVHSKNGGVSAARNVGLQLATGDWVAFLDADDEFMPSFVEVALKRAVALGVPIVYGTETSRYESCEVLNSFGIGEHQREMGPDKTSLLREYFLTYLNPWGSGVPSSLRRSLHAKLYRRDVLDGVWFDPFITYGEDAVFNCDVLAGCDRVALVDATWYVYKRVEGSAVSRLRFGNEFFGHIAAVVHHYENSSEMEPLVNVHVTSYLFATIVSHLASGRTLAPGALRAALRSEVVRGALCRTDFNRYESSRGGKLRYFLAKHGLAVPLLLYYLIAARLHQSEPMLKRV